MINLSKLIIVLSLLLISNAFSSISIKEHSNNFENFRTFIKDYNFSTNELHQASNEYHLDYLYTLEEKKTELSVLQLFKEKSIENPQFVYTHYILSLNKLNKISKDYQTNQEMLDGLFISMFGDSKIQYSKNNELINLTSSSCLCATEGSCDNGETETSCSPDEKPYIEKLVPIAGLGGIAVALREEKKPIYAGTTKKFNASIADGWISNSEYNNVNLARDLSLIQAYDDNTLNYIDNNDSTQVYKNNVPSISLLDFPHPYTQLGVNDAYGYGLSGSGVTVSVIDSDLCYSQASGTYSNDNYDHYDLQGKTVTIYGNYTYNAFEGASEWVNSPRGHGCHVATTAVGVYNLAAKPSDASNVSAYYYWNAGLSEADLEIDSGYSIDLPSSMMGVAYNSNLHFAQWNGASNDFCSGDAATNCLGPQHWELSTEDGKANGAKVQNNSWYYLGDTTPGMIESYGPGTKAKRFADYINEYVGGGNVTETQINEWVEAYDSFQDQGVIVWASSNDNDGNMSTVWGAAENSSEISESLPQLFPELAEAWISVSNVVTYSDGSKILISAPCAANAAYCVVHDGFRITAGTDVFKQGSNYSSFISTFYGTSMASPQISGAIALLFEAFPDNSPELITKRLLFTADNSWFDSNKCFKDNNGNYAVDTDELSNYCGGQDGEATYNGLVHSYSNLYGHGNPDLHLALQPIGLNTIKGIRGDEMLLVGSVLALSTYTGDSLLLNNERAIFRDQLNGGFDFNVGDLVVQNYDTRLFDRMKKSRFDQWYTFNQSENLHLSFASANYDHNNNQLNDDMGIYTSFTSGSQTFYSGHNYSMDQLLGLRNGNNAFSVLTSHNNDNSFLTLTEAAGKGQLFGNNIKIDSNTTLNIVAYTGENDQQALDEKGFLASISNATDNYNDITFFIGQNLEEDSILRINGTGAFGNLSGETLHTGFTFNSHIHNNLHIAGLANLGISNNKSEEYGLISNFNDILTSQFNVGLVATGVSSSNDLISLNISQPLRTEGGTVNLNLPSTMNLDGTHNFNIKKINLEPSGREINFDFGYEMQLHNKSAFRIGSQITLEPSHIKNNSSNELVYGSYKIQF